MFKEIQVKILSNSAVRYLLCDYICNNRFASEVRGFQLPLVCRITKEAFRKHTYST